MKKVSITDFPIMEFGNERQLAGCVYSGKGQSIVVLVPDEHEDTMNFLTGEYGEVVACQPSAAEWVNLLNQTDLLNVMVGPSKAIKRKTQRQIDSKMSWDVYRRDEFRCRYCHGEKPLTVDHVDLWENGGATIVENLIAACRDCNKTRGNREYDEWIDSSDYKRRSSRLPKEVKERNMSVVDTLPFLRSKRVEHQRSR